MTYFAQSTTDLDKARPFVYNILCVFGGSLFLALLAQFSLPLWFTPVPITLQTLGVMLIGSLLGSKRGALAVLAYLGEGALGFPVFSHGNFGLMTLIGPTGGYLFAFVIAAYLIGFCAEKGWQKNFFLTLSSFIFNSSLILVLGALWLGFYVGFHNALIMGIFPFLIGCGLKSVVAALIVFGKNVFEKNSHLQ